MDMAIVIDSQARPQPRKSTTRFDKDPRTSQALLYREAHPSRIIQDRRGRHALRKLRKHSVSVRWRCAAPLEGIFKDLQAQ